MAVTLNHTIIPAHDKQASAEFLAHILGLRVGSDPSGYFAPIEIGNGLTLLYEEGRVYQDGFPPLHYAFVVSDDEFDAAFTRLTETATRYYAHPHKAEETNSQISYTAGGGRGLYFDDLNGHNMELMTIPEEPDEEWWIGPYRSASDGAAQHPLRG